VEGADGAFRSAGRGVRRGERHEIQIILISTTYQSP
jgi:hypothetical protein